MDRRGLLIGCGESDARRVAEGLGTCWIGFAQGFLNTLEGKKVLGLPAAWVSISPIIVGHPKGQAAPVPRKEPQIRWPD